MKSVIVIPARWGSTRFPGKPLYPLGGKPLLQHVWERCLQSTLAAEVIVATDDMRIAEAAFDFGADVALTSARHPTGTDRVAEVARKLRGVSVVVNVQGDEPLIEPEVIDQLIESLAGDRRLAMSTAAAPLDRGDLDNPNVVKVVTDLGGRALYFSRAGIPVDRDGDVGPARWRHLGIYAYRRAFLLKFVQWKPTPLERCEKLEQLRALEHGASIHVVTVREAGPGIDTPADAAAFERMFIRKTGRVRARARTSASPGR
ncbi:MAG: 3-deoxy-manno-octulosonate cytidylyltransferase [Terrimicrobiaceae bacterium]|nr:3-deoxy-manno-octulosonate cytidylyltransferase [Terrimicrobiaceae bacterium]